MDLNIECEINHENGSEAVSNEVEVSQKPQEPLQENLEPLCSPKVSNEVEVLQEPQQPLQENLEPLCSPKVSNEVEVSQEPQEPLQENLEPLCSPKVSNEVEVLQEPQQPLQENLEPLCSPKVSNEVEVSQEPQEPLQENLEPLCSPKVSNEVEVLQEPQEPLQENLEPLCSPKVSNEVEVLQESQQPLQENLEPLCSPKVSNEVEVLQEPQQPLQENLEPLCSPKVSNEVEVLQEPQQPLQENLEPLCSPTVSNEVEVLQEPLRENLEPLCSPSVALSVNDSSSSLETEHLKPNSICDKEAQNSPGEKCTKTNLINCNDFKEDPLSLGSPKRKCLNTKRRSGVLYKHVKGSKTMRVSSKYFNQVHNKQKPWIPPRSPYSLVQEDLFDKPWQLLIATIFLTKTAAKRALPQLHKFLARYPRPEDVLQAKYEDIDEYFKPLGLTTTRSHIVMRFTAEFLEKEWTYPRELYGIGKYGDDSYRIFCINEWQQVSPDDIPLTMYRNWLLENAERLGIN